MEAARGCLFGIWRDIWIQFQLVAEVDYVADLVNLVENTVFCRIDLQDHIILKYASETYVENLTITFVYNKKPSLSLPSLLTLYNQMSYGSSGKTKTQTIMVERNHRHVPCRVFPLRNDTNLHRTHLCHPLRLNGTNAAWLCTLQ